MGRKRQPGRATRWGLRIGLVVLAALGATLLAPVDLAGLFSVHIDAGARTALGASLVAGVIVGSVLVAYEHLLAAGRTRETQERRTLLREGVSAEADRVVASLLGAHVMTLIGAFLDVAPVRTPRGPIRGSSVIPDARFTLRRLTRSGLRVEAGRSWWRDDPDGIDEVVHNYVAAVMLAEQVGIPVVPVWDEIGRARHRAAERLTRMAERLSEEGFAAEAQDMDELAEALESGWGLLDLEHRATEPEPALGPWRSLIAEACWLGRRLGGRAGWPVPAGDPAREPAPIAT